MATFTETFFETTFDWPFLRKIHDHIQAHSITVPSPAGGTIEVPAALHLPGNGKLDQPPFILMSAIHGNEPAGLAAAHMCIELQRAGLLDAPVYCVIGNHYAARQYFEIWDPEARQETRDDFRMGRDTEGRLMRDLNRIPPNVWELDASEHYHTARAQALDALAATACGILDIHSARGDLPCLTNYSDAKMLRYSPIRIVLEGLLDSIARHTSSVTFKQLIKRHPHQKHSYGIEAGRHEDPDAPHLAAAFTLALLHNLGITSAPPLPIDETGKFQAFAVGEVMKLKDLTLKGTPGPEDLFYTVRPCTDPADIPGGCEDVIVQLDDGSFRAVEKDGHAAHGKLKFWVHQFGELEAVDKDALIALAVPSGAALHAPFALHTLFASKLKRLYNDPIASVVPFTYAEMDKKFGHPCTPHELRINFSD